MHDQLTALLENPDAPMRTNRILRLLVEIQVASLTGEMTRAQFVADLDRAHADGITLPRSLDVQRRAVR